MKLFVAKARIGIYLFFCFSVLFSTQSLASPAGEINFADLSGSYGEAKVEINLEKGLIGMIGAFSKQEDPEVAQLLENIEMIKVRVYELKGNAKKALEVVDEVTGNIRKANWEPLVSVNEKGSRVRMFSRVSDGKMDGLVVMVVDEQGAGEAVFINIVGEIDPSQVSKVTKSLNIDMGPN